MNFLDRYFQFKIARRGIYSKYLISAEEEDNDYDEKTITISHIIYLMAMPMLLVFQTNEINLKIYEISNFSIPFPSRLDRLGFVVHTKFNLQ